MRIKAKLLLPRKELDALGNEIDPRQELIDKILEYKKYKEAAVQMADLEALRMLMMKRGNIQSEMSLVGEEAVGLFLGLGGVPLWTLASARPDGLGLAAGHPLGAGLGELALHVHALRLGSVAAGGALRERRRIQISGTECRGEF